MNEPVCDALGVLDAVWVQEPVRVAVTLGSLKQRLKSSRASWAACPASARTEKVIAILFVPLLEGITLLLTLYHSEACAPSPTVLV